MSSHTPSEAVNPLPQQRLQAPAGDDMDTGDDADGTVAEVMDCQGITSTALDNGTPIDPGENVSVMVPVESGLT